MKLYIINLSCPCYNYILHVLTNLTFFYDNVLPHCNDYSTKIIVRRFFLPPFFRVVRFLFPLPLPVDFDRGFLRDFCEDAVPFFLFRDVVFEDGFVLCLIDVFADFDASDCFESDAEASICSEDFAFCGVFLIAEGVRLLDLLEDLVVLFRLDFLVEIPFFLVLLDFCFDATTAFVV